MGKKPKYKPFPKKKRGQYRVVDVDKLRDLYLNGPDVTFRAFCIRNGFCPVGTKSEGGWYAGVDLTEWKTTWLKKHFEIQDDEILAEMIAARKLVNAQRINFITDWNARAQTMKKMIDFMMNVHINDMRHDVAKALEIRAGKARKLCQLGASEMATMAMAAERIQALEAKSLMLMPIHFRNVDKAEDEEVDPVPQLEIHTMGAAGMAPEEVTKLMVNYFDQIDKPMGLEVKRDEPDTAEN